MEAVNVTVLEVEHGVEGNHVFGIPVCSLAAAAASQAAACRFAELCLLQTKDV